MIEELLPKHPSVLMRPERLMQQIVEVAVDQTKANSGSLMLLNPNTQALDIEAAVGLSARAKRMKLQLLEGVTGWVASTGKPCLVNDVHADKRYVPVSTKIRSELAVPIEMDGHVVGVLNVDGDRVGAFTVTHQEMLMTLVKEAAEWVRFCWDMNQLKSRSHQLESLLNMGQTIISEYSLDEILRRITADAAELMQAKLCSIMLKEGEEELVLKAWHGASRAYIRKPNIQISDSLVGVVMRRKKNLAILNVQENQRYQHTELARREGLVSLLSVPLVFQGEALGVLSVYTGTLHRFSNEEIRMLNAMGELGAVAIAKAQLIEKVIGVEEQLKASERLSALGWLAAEIAHEIRNPLTVIQMLFHALVENNTLDKTSEKDAALIDVKMKQLNRTLDQVLSFARSSEPVMEEIDPAQMLDDIILLVRHKLSSQEIDVERKGTSQELMLQGDRVQLEQSLLNLVLNACHAMPKGGKLTLSLREKKDNGTHFLIIGVGDTGHGMSKTARENMFRPFLSYKVGGTGLGLALVSKTVENHGGEIRVDSKLGEGTLFELFFPALRKEDLER